MNTLNLSELIPRCHDAARANGWWENPVSLATSLMLISSEMGECLDADRNGHRADLSAYEKHLLDIRAEGSELLGDFPRDANGDQMWPNEFAKWVKNSVEDELADTVIRICDTAGGYGLDAAKMQRSADSVTGSVVPTSLPEALWTANSVLTAIKAYSGAPPSTVRLGEVVGVLMCYCERQGIDLARHIDLKLALNATRGHKHNGKAY